jgi:4-hydroxybenzoate polyprenyltransferase
MQEHGAFIVRTDGGNPMSNSQAARPILEQHSGEIPTLHRWWVYQRERFPILAQGSLIAVLSLSAVSYSALLRGDHVWPAARSAVAAFLSTLLFFLQLRIADEWKDAEDDARFRPYRPVPRGIVTLKELRTIGLTAALVQLVLALWLSAALVPLLLVVWAYMGLMSKEFFARKWMKAHPVAYLASHMPALPLIYLYATACDWGVAGGVKRAAIGWFLLVGLFNGLVFEIGRKIRALQDEEYGVETYTRLWGSRKSVLVWFGALLLSAAAASMAASQIHWLTATALLLGTALAIALEIGVQFLQQPVSALAKRIEVASGAWALIVHLALGPLPLLFPRGNGVR